MAAWPVTLPQCALASGYEESPQSQVLRSQMDAGPAKTRRRFTAGTTDVAFAVNLTPDQVETFETFYDSDIAAGSLPFDIEHPRKKTTVSVRMKGDQPYTLAPVGSGALYRLTMTLEVLP